MRVHLNFKLMYPIFSQCTLRVPWRLGARCFVRTLDSGLWLQPRPCSEIGFEQITTHRFLIRGGKGRRKTGKTWKRGDQGKLRHLMATEIT